MANKVVFDASALITLFAKESGYETVQQHMRYSLISSVNLAEVYKYCIDRQKLTENDCKNLIALSGIKIVDFCKEQALISASMIGETKKYGLSLGDRSCLALAIVKQAPVLSCDRIWQKVDLAIDFIMAR